MARSNTLYTLKDVADMIGENLELIEDVTANSDNIAESERVYGVYPNKGTKCDIGLSLISDAHDCLPAGFKMACNG